MRVRQILPFVAAAGAAVVVGVLTGYWTLGRQPASPTTAALLLHPAKALPPFSLEDDSGTPFTRANLQGHWSLLYFGYTHCPDVCPTTLADLTRMTAKLQTLPASQQPHVYFVSVDPKRDKPAVLKDYVQYFDVAFTGVTGTTDNLRALTKPLGVAFSYEPPDQSGNYGVDHSAAVFMINPHGEETAIYTPPLIAERMAADYNAIVAYYGDHR